MLQQTHCYAILKGDSLCHGAFVDERLQQACKIHDFEDLGLKSSNINQMPSSHEIGPLVEWKSPAEANMDAWIQCTCVYATVIYQFLQMGYKHLNHLETLVCSAHTLSNHAQTLVAIKHFRGSTNRGWCARRCSAMQGWPPRVCQFKLEGHVHHLVPYILGLATVMVLSCLWTYHRVRKKELAKIPLVSERPTSHTARPAWSPDPEQMLFPKFRSWSQTWHSNQQ